MYSVVLMAALAAGGQTPNCHGCHASYGGCYGSCYGNYGLEGYGGGCNSCCGNSYTCSGGCYGSCWGAGYGSCWGNSYTCGGGCWGAGYGCYGGYYPWDYSSSGCCGCEGYGGGSPYFATPPVYGPPTGTPVEPPVKSEPIPAPKKGEPEGLAPTNARLIVAVPAGANLYIDDHKMKTQSERRTFQTPVLEPGQTYFYEVRVEVERDGKTLSTTKRVLLKAGQEVRADFNDMDATVTAKAK